MNKTTDNITHCFSIDVEGFCEGHSESFPMPPTMIRGPEEKEEIGLNVEEVLEFLDACKIKGTFFVLGVIAKEQPDVLRRIANRGHEIASHGYNHVNLFRLGHDKVKKEIGDSKKAIEDVLGKGIYGFRAPCFSIKKDSMYILDIIHEAGFIYDSTIINHLSAGNFSKDGGDISILPNGLIEYPPSAYKIGARLIPALGGGYFRLFPLALIRTFMKSLQKNNRCAISYIHPYEIGSHYPVFSGLSVIKKFRYYVNVDEPKKKFEQLFKEFSFGRIIDVLRLKGYIGQETGS